MPRGGKRNGAGMPWRNIHLSEDAARTLRILALNRRSLMSEPRPSTLEIAEQIVDEWLAEEWRKLDTEIEQAIEIMGDTI